MLMYILLEFLSLHVFILLCVFSYINCVCLNFPLPVNSSFDVMHCTCEALLLSYRPIIGGGGGPGPEKTCNKRPWSTATDRAGLQKSPRDDRTLESDEEETTENPGVTTCDTRSGRALTLCLVCEYPFGTFSNVLVWLSQRELCLFERVYWR